MRDNILESEDWVFCNIYRKIGIPVYMNSNVVTTNIGSYTFSATPKIMHSEEKVGTRSLIYCCVFFNPDYLKLLESMVDSLERHKHLNYKSTFNYKTFFKRLKNDFE